MKLAASINRTHALLIDFDGPVCDVFAGIPAAVVAAQLRLVLTDSGHIDLPDRVLSSPDPFDVLFYASTLGGSAGRDVEVAFVAHEVEAISTARPTLGAHELIKYWHELSRPIAIVSNNSVLAIESYLDLYELRPSVDFVSGRRNADVTLLKPNPHLLYEAIRTLAVTPQECSFIGDSISDIDAARSAGVYSIAYVNKARKVSELASADALIEEMTSLRSML
ncbi:HAD-IA family hydrolase [Amycolatopsis sp. NBC_00348]|uniref:HAD family hydrolase n=1 Tax=Amycolatopsis sp. NBC_00348 TaxID=2975956 RepID=UPI002E2711EA